MINPQMIFSKVYHSRTTEIRHSFEYSVPYLYFNVKTAELAGKLLSKKTLGLYNFRTQDYLRGKPGSLETNIQDFLLKNLNYSADEIFLISSPRTLGYVFNPINFWLCQNQGVFNSALIEVNNTFGERHFYWIDEAIPLNQDHWFHATKKFYVSPFMEVEGYYNFKFKIKKRAVKISINYYSDSDQLKLATTIKGRSTSLQKINGLKTLFKFGPSSLMIIFRIHLQALKLYMKAVALKSKPSQDNKDVT